MRDFIQEKQGLKARRSAIIENRPFLDDLPNERKPPLSELNGKINIVYTGAILLDGYRRYYDIFSRILGKGFVLHIYTTSSEAFKKEYERILSGKGELIFHDPLPHKELLKEITQYDYGIVPFVDKEDIEHLDIAIPNKFYEYLGCGLRVIASPLRTMSRLIQENQCGLLIDERDLREEINEDFKRTGGNLDQKDVSRFCHESQMDIVRNFFKETYGT
jgi:hypothetical protein